MPRARGTVDGDAGRANHGHVHGRAVDLYSVVRAVEEKRTGSVVGRLYEPAVLGIDELWSSIVESIVHVEWGGVVVIECE